MRESLSGNPECERWQQGIGCQLCQRLMEKIRSWTGSIKPAAARIWDKMYGKILLCKITDLYGGIRLENIHQTAAHVILAILKYEQNGPIRLKKNWNNVTISPIKILPPHGAGYMEKGGETSERIRSRTGDLQRMLQEPDAGRICGRAADRGSGCFYKR